MILCQVILYLDFIIRDDNCNLEREKDRDLFENLRVLLTVTIRLGWVINVTSRDYFIHFRLA